MLSMDFISVELRFGHKRLFQDFSRQLVAGRLIAVTGVNGSGKSTFLRLAAGLIRPDSGQVLTREDGNVLSAENLMRKTAMVTPEMRLYPRLTAIENLRFFLGLRNEQLAAIDPNELWERVELDKISARNAWVGQLSTGMQQRVKLAILLATNAALWLMDEPTANLDDAGRELMLQEARNAAKSGAMVLWATNNRREEAAADEVIRLGGNEGGLSQGIVDGL